MRGRGPQAGDGHRLRSITINTARGQAPKLPYLLYVSTGQPNHMPDYIPASRHWELAEYRVESEFTFSDHYPVYAEFDLRDR